MVEWMMEWLGYQDITSLILFVLVSISIIIYMFEESLRKTLFKVMGKLRKQK